MNLSQKEIESIIKLSPLDRYKHFIKKVADSELLFSIQDNSYEWMIAKVEGHKLFSLWHASEYAKKCLINSWKNYNVIEISLDEFDKNILPLVLSNNYLLNIFSVEDKTGFVIDIEEFKADLEEELRKYE